MGNTVFVLTNITAIIMMFGLYVCAYKGLDYGYREVKVICFMAVLIVVESVFEIISNYIMGNSSLIWLNYLANTSMYIINILLSVSWILYVYTKINRKKKKIDKRKWALIFFPGFVVFVMIIANLFTPVLYSLDENNNYSRTSLYIVPVIVALGYILFGLLIFTIKRKKSPKYSFHPSLSFILPVLLYQIFQNIFQENSLTTLGLALGIVSVYMSFKNEASCIDFLSGLYNRQYFERYLENIIRKKNQKKHLVGIMLDIDKFKSINDTYGHIVGNDAITDAAEMLLDTCQYFKSKIKAFRYGGDEFVLLILLNEESDVELIIKKIQNKSKKFNESGKKPYKINFSLGYTFFRAGEPIPEFVSRMDMKMYENKEQKRNFNKICQPKKNFC